VGKNDEREENMDVGAGRGIPSFVQIQMALLLFWSNSWQLSESSQLCQAFASAATCWRY
jgi:hypothetical protein